MTEPLCGHDPQALLAHDRFVRSLARSLVSDAEGAEDVAQQTWLAALTHSAPTDRLRAWLATIAANLARNARRALSRRAHHERLAARDEQTPSPSAIREREAARREVVEAVLALEEPYQTTMVLRYLEGLPPRAVAQRMRVPVETVRTRTKRALVQLRSALDRRYGGERRAWSLPLASLLGPREIVTGSSLAAGALMVTGKLKLVGATALVAGLLLLVWALQEGDHVRDPRPIAVGEPTEATGAMQPGANSASSDAAPATESRAAVASLPTVPSGSLLVRLVWQRDRSPASGMHVHVRPQEVEVPILDEQVAVSDAEGCARFGGVPPGYSHVTTDRAASGSVKVTPSEPSQLTIELPDGRSIAGVVVDQRGDPVAGAELRHPDMHQSHVAMLLGHTREDGSFLLEHVGVGAGSLLEARAKGHSPSGRYPLGRGGNEKLRLVLGPLPGTVSGRVLDPQGRPAANAFVLIAGEGRSLRGHRLEDGTSGFPPRPGFFRTDPLGRFRGEDIPPGTHAVLARGPGSAPWTGTVNVSAGAESVLLIDLVAGVTVEGVVRSARGEPVWGAYVQEAEWDRLVKQRTSTQADGRYRLTGLAPGDLRLEAGGSEHDKTTGTLHANAGDRLVWNPVLAKGLGLRGRVVDERGKPRPGCFVDVATRTDPPWTERKQTDKDGRFEIEGCPDEPLYLEVIEPGSRYGVAQREGVRAGGEEIHIVVRRADLPSVYIRGELRSPEGEPITTGTVSPSRWGGYMAEIVSVDAKTGGFSLGPYPPGEWTVSFNSRGFAHLRLSPRRLSPGATWDLGTVTLERPGFLEIEAQRTDGKPLPDGYWIGALNLERQSHDPTEVKHGTVARKALASGTYLLSVRAKEFAQASVLFTIRSGETTRLSVTLRPGIARSVRFVLPDDASGEMVTVRVRDATGAEVLTELVSRKPGQLTCDWPVSLAAGTYEVEATTTGKSGRGTLTCSTDPLREPLLVELR